MYTLFYRYTKKKKRNIRTSVRTYVGMYVHSKVPQVVYLYSCFFIYKTQSCPCMWFAKEGRLVGRSVDRTVKRICGEKR